MESQKIKIELKEVNLSPEDQKKIRRWERVGSVLVFALAMSVFCAVIMGVAQCYLAMFCFAGLGILCLAAFVYQRTNPPRTDASRLADELVSDEDRYWTNLYGA